MSQTACCRARLSGGRGTRSRLSNGRGSVTMVAETTQPLLAVAAPSQSRLGNASLRDRILAQQTLDGATGDGAAEAVRGGLRRGENTNHGACRRVVSAEGGSAERGWKAGRGGGVRWSVEL
jgi:hypothetical protein